MPLGSLVYGPYERSLNRQVLAAGCIPRHVGVILDGNRRWAKSAGESAAHGHRAGADKITEVLEWSREVGVEVVTLWLLSTDNLSRDEAELTALVDIIADAIDVLADDGRWNLQHMGDVSLLPATTVGRIAAAIARSQGEGRLHVNVAVGYGGRHEIAEAVRASLRRELDSGKALADVVEDFSIEHITEHLYTSGQPDPDLVIRTSGEQRLSGFLMWQSAHTEFYFCEAYWPDFRRIDFLRALRSYAQRERRRGK